MQVEGEPDVELPGKRRAERKAEAGVRRARRAAARPEMAFAEAGDIRGVEIRGRVGDHQRHRFLPRAAGYFDAPTVRRMIDRIAEQVGEDALDEEAIGHDPALGIEPHVQRDAPNARARLAGQTLRARRGRDVDRLDHRRVDAGLVARQREQAVDDAAHARQRAAGKREP